MLSNSESMRMDTKTPHLLSTFRYDEYATLVECINNFTSQDYIQSTSQPILVYFVHSVIGNVEQQAGKQWRYSKKVAQTTTTTTTNL